MIHPSHIVIAGFDACTFVHQSTISSSSFSLKQKNNKSNNNTPIENFLHISIPIMTIQTQLIRIVLYFIIICSSCCSNTVYANCPPSVISSFEELHEYCPDASAENGDYACYKHNRVVCRGTIDHRHTPPFCTHSTIRDCSDEQYYHVCAYGHKNCNHRSDFTFVCWDKQQGHWCQGTVEPDKGTRTYPVCPRDTLYDCGELYRYGLDADHDCDCSAFFGGPIQYECRNKNGHAWCSYRSNFFFGGSHSSHSSWTWDALWVWGTPPSSQETKGAGYSTTRSNFGSIGLGFFVVLAVLLSVLRRNQKTRVTSLDQPQYSHESTALLASGNQLKEQHPTHK